MRLVCLMSFLCICALGSSHEYQFNKEDPIDVLIPCARKDLPTLNHSIDAIRKYGKNVRRVMVVSKERLTKKAEWIPEDKFPFSFYDISLQIFQNPINAKKYLKSKANRIGWLFQQLIKLYAPYVIEGISSNVFILDADVVFLNPVDFFNEKTGGAYFNVSGENHEPYFVHAQKLVPGFKKVYPEHSGICHCMLMQKPVLDKLFESVEKEHGKEFWRAFIDCIDQKFLNLSSASEYEIYFNFAFMTSDQFTLRPLKWADVGSLHRFLRKRNKYHDNNYHYIAYPSYHRLPYYLKFL